MTRIHMPKFSRRMKVMAVALVAVLGLAVASPILSKQAFAGIGGPLVLPHWQYSAKFVCGAIPDGETELPAEPPLKPGNYASAINIHNSQVDSHVDIFVKIVLTETEGEPVILDPDRLDSDQAFEIDCELIDDVLPPEVLPPEVDFIKGFVVIGAFDYSLDDPLDVVAVYTSLKQAESEVLKNKVFFEIAANCEALSDEDLAACGAYVASNAELFGEKLEVITQVGQDELIDPEEIARSALPEFGFPDQGIAINLLDVDSALGIGIGTGQSIDVERVPAKFVIIPIA